MIGQEIIFLEEVDSTNRYMMDLLSRQPVNSGTVVRAGFQTAGRGMDNNAWESAPGLNLTFSFVIYPSYLGADQQFYLNKVISLALADLLATEMPDPSLLRIKWPNDIYAGNRKLAGMLVQNGVKGNRFEFSVIGIGLNVNQESFQSHSPDPVSLKNLSGKEYNLDLLLGKLLASIESRLGMLERGERPVLDKDYLERLYQLGTVERYIYKGREIIAKINGVNRYGQLILEIPGEKILECDLKEVKFVL